MKKNAIYCASSNAGSTRIVSRTDYVCTPAPDRKEEQDFDTKYWNRLSSKERGPNVRVFIVQ
jgi:hypothetical protein